jgi:hypothetical protein
MANKTSQHITGYICESPGVCLFVITALHFTNKTENTYFDEITSVVALCLTLSSVLSFISIRTQNERREYILEQIADYLFIFSLVSIMILISFVIFKFWV